MEPKLNAADEVESGCEQLMAALGRLKAETAKREPIPPPEMPDGYEWRDEYRWPREGEFIIGFHTGDAIMAKEDYEHTSDSERYIIYPIEPKFKLGTCVVDEGGRIAIMSNQGPRWLHGGLTSDNIVWQSATDDDIRNCVAREPNQAYLAIECLADSYAKEAPQ